MDRVLNPIEKQVVPVIWTSIRSYLKKTQEPRGPRRRWLVHMSIYNRYTHKPFEITRALYTAGDRAMGAHGVGSSAWDQ